MYSKEGGGAYREGLYMYSKVRGAYRGGLIYVLQGVDGLIEGEAYTCTPRWGEAY